MATSSTGNTIEVRVNQMDHADPDLSPNDETTKLKAAIAREKAAKRKMYSYLVKIADELKALRNESEQLIKAADYARKAWYEGGMWRGPNVLPGLGGGGGEGPPAAATGARNTGATGGMIREGGQVSSGMPGPTMVPRAPVSLSDLFLDLVTVTAFSRVGAVSSISMVKS